MPFLKVIMGSLLKVFYNIDLPGICESVLLECLLNLVKLDYMFLIMLCTVYQYAFIGGAVVLDRGGQPSEFTV